MTNDNGELLYHSRAEIWEEIGTLKTDVYD
jgi:biotin operon repressor